jgi:hypothetical protein
MKYKRLKLILDKEGLLEVDYEATEIKEGLSSTFPRK